MAETQNNLEQNEDFNCTVAVTDSGPWKKKITVNVPREEIDKELDNQYGELKRAAEIPGFRKGHAPRKLIEKRFGEDVVNQAKLRLLAQAFDKIDDEQDFEILGEPDFNPDDIVLPETGNFDFEYEIEVKPEFDIPELEGIKVEKSIIEITDERIDETILDVRRRQGHLDEVDAAEENDAVWGKVTMKVDGIEEPVVNENAMVRVTKSSPVEGVLVEGMDDILKGMKPGETRTCSAEVPDTHQNEEFRGKKADFTIESDVIRRLMPAEMNETFFATMGVKDETELKRLVRDTLENQVDGEVRRQMAQSVYKYLEENIEFELPAGIAARHAERVVTRQYYELLRQGVSQDKLMEDIEKIKAASSQQAAQELKMSFIMERVADKLEVEVSDMEVNGYIARMAMQQQRRPEKLRDELSKAGRLNMIREEIREEKAIEKILEMAEVVDAPEKSEEKAAPKAKKAAKKTTKKATKKVAKKDDSDDEKAESKKTSRKEVKRKPPSADKE